MSLISSDRDDCKRGAQDRELYYGAARVPTLGVVPDSTYPLMWRIRTPDGELSDMVNLSRAKDAAVAIAERGPPVRNRARLHWIKTRSESPPEARTSRQTRAAA